MRMKTGPVHLSRNKTMLQMTELSDVLKIIYIIPKERETDTDTEPGLRYF